MSEDLRASDAEREQTVNSLRAAAGEGRLSVEELDERTAAAYAAKTRGELAALCADLPPQPLRAQQPARSVPLVPGRVVFSARWRAPGRPHAVVGGLLSHVAPPLHAHGYELVERTPERLVFMRSRRPGWTIAVAILLFPFGLIALAHKDRDRIAIDLLPEERDTALIVQGVAPLAVRRAFAQLERDANDPTSPSRR